MAEDPLHFSVRCDELAPRVVRGIISGLSEVDWVLGDAMLVASELVNNAVVHSRGSEDDVLTVCIRRNHRLRISVVDPGRSGREARITDRPVELGGLGLKVVEQLAASWGAERVRDGYEVWAELDVAR